MIIRLYITKGSHVGWFALMMGAESEMMNEINTKDFSRTQAALFFFLIYLFYLNLLHFYFSEPAWAVGHSVAWESVDGSMYPFTTAGNSLEC